MVDKLIEQFKIAKESDDKEPCTKEELQEFFEDGVAIIDFVKKRRNDYFGKRGYKLIGCEVPINVKLKKDIKMVGYLDVVILDEFHNTLKIIDIKTSTTEKPKRYDEIIIADNPYELERINIIAL